MNPGRLAGACALALSLASCASRAPVPALPPGPAVELAQTPFFPQDDYQCGPAALATVLVADGVEVSPEQLVPQVYVPERQGSLQPEMTAAVRRHGRVPTPLPPRLDAITDALRSGRPVLVFLNLGLEAMPVWHYAVVVGFDPAADTLLLRSGREARQSMRRSRFDAAWARGGRWALTVADPGTVPAGATPESWIAALAPFESQREFTLAERGYRAAVTRWPQAPLPHTALGNVHAARGDWLGAVEAYSEALARGAAPILLNNRAYALAQLGCAEAAQSDLQRGLALESSAEVRATLEQTRQELAQAGTPVRECPPPVLQSLLRPDPPP